MNRMAARRRDPISARAPPFREMMNGKADSGQNTWVSRTLTRRNRTAGQIEIMFKQLIGAIGAEFVERNIGLHDAQSGILDFTRIILQSRQTEYRQRSQGGGGHRRKKALGFGVP